MGAGHLHLAVRGQNFRVTKESTATAKVRLPEPLGSQTNGSLHNRLVQ
ncbi:hypothetical protein AB0M87_16620 [Streptomyces sp. NPDC051320]